MPRSFDHDGRFDMGVLKKKSFIDAWHSEKFQDLRAANLVKKVTGTPCEQCIAYRAACGEPESSRELNLRLSLSPKGLSEYLYFSIGQLAHPAG